MADEKPTGLGYCRACRTEFACVARIQVGKEDGAGMQIISDRPCPKCGTFILGSHKGFPEAETIRAEHIGPLEEGA